MKQYLEELRSKIRTARSTRACNSLTPRNSSTRTNSSTRLVSTRHASTWLACAALAAFGATAQAATSATAAAPAKATGPAQDEKPRSYVRAGSNGATVRNLGDRSGHPILRAETDDLFAVYDQRGDWLQVEAAGGFEVWVYGKYVSETNVPGVLQVSGNHVNMRPKPSSDVDSFPLPKRLFTGDRVVYLGRARASTIWDEDWIQIASPPGVRAWVLASETTSVPTGEGAGAWGAAVAAARARPAPAPVENRTGSSETTGNTAGATKPAAPLAEEKQEAVRALRRADELFSTERLKDQPDLELVRTAYEEVLTVTDTGSTADLARSGLSRVDALAEARALQAELEAERIRREAEAERYRSELEEARARQQDPFAGRYSYRGWLERTPSKSGMAPTYTVRFGGREVVEVVCSSGRYDLDDFTDFEIGVRGAVLREGVAVPKGQAGTILPSLDVGRIEVLSGRSR